jgi:hypothetical protein
VFGADIGGGFDIGCKFRITLNRSELGPRARALNYKALVGSFHGHAHNRLCQLSFLATYVKGMGIEDLEGCERFFSKSNALASSLRYASIFHRQQKMVEFMKHMDNMETYQNLSKLPTFLNVRLSDYPQVHSLLTTINKPSTFSRELRPSRNP